MNTVLAPDDVATDLAATMEKFTPIDTANLDRNNDLIRNIRRTFLAQMKESHPEYYEIANICIQWMSHTGHSSLHVKARPNGILSGEDICALCDEVNTKRKPPLEAEKLDEIKQSFLKLLEGIRPYLKIKEPAKGR